MGADVCKHGPKSGGPERVLIFMSVHALPTPFDFSCDYDYFADFSFFSGELFSTLWGYILGFSFFSGELFNTLWGYILGFSFCIPFLGGG